LTSHVDRLAAKGTGASPDRWIIRRRSRASPAVRLLCFPYAGSGASVFRAWHAELSAETEVLLVQPPGREGRISEPPLHRLEELVGQVADALGAQLEPPYALFGHSLGALAAFELARELRRRGYAPPVALVVAGREAPHIPDPDSPLHLLPDQGLIEEVCRRYSGIPREVLAEPALVELLLPALRADLAMNETYAYAEAEPLQCPIYVYGGDQDARVSSSDLQGWGIHTHGGFAVRMFSGGHFFIQNLRTAVLTALSQDLAKALT
jgi:medium-chain acyl-[acyl-carrier-protein] hydrolase